MSRDLLVHAEHGHTRRSGARYAGFVNVRTRGDVQPYVEDPDFRLYQGDALEVLRQLPDESVDCALTSPPFYALRDYGVEGQIGLEATPDEWAARLVEVFREVRRVLVDTGTLWIECGDSYASGGWGEPSASSSLTGGGKVVTGGSAGTRKPAGYKPKDLLGTPWLLAFALRGDGWYLRQAIVWHKPNAMPESAKDRCTTAHSYVFLLSKRARYHFDAEAIAEPAEWAAWGAQTDLKRGKPGSENARGTAMGYDTYGRQKIRELQGLGKPQEEVLVESDSATTRSSPAADGAAAGDRDRCAGEHERNVNGDRVGSLHLSRRLNGKALGQKHARSVWTIPTQGYPEAHFATWPEALVERIIKAGCPAGGTVLDPFMGSGTTALVARKLGRRSVGIELNQSYCALAAKRLQQLSLLAEPA